MLAPQEQKQVHFGSQNRSLLILCRVSRPLFQDIIGIILEILELFRRVLPIIRRVLFIYRRDDITRQTLTSYIPSTHHKTVHSCTRNKKTGSSIMSQQNFYKDSIMLSTISEERRAASAVNSAKLAGASPFALSEIERIMTNGTSLRNEA